RRVEPLCPRHHLPVVRVLPARRTFLFLAGSVDGCSRWRYCIAFARRRTEPKSCPRAPTFVVLALSFCPVLLLRGGPMSDSLSAELASLKAAAAHNGGRFQRLDDLCWPKDARIAVNITVDFDAMLLRRLNNEP